MPLFIVDRDLIGLTAEALAEHRRCLREATLRASRGGLAIRHLRRTFTHAHDRCLDLFEADSAEVVGQVNDMAQLPYRSIARASDDAAPGLAP